MSLAGHLGLSKLIVLYDSNDIQLDGQVKGTNSEKVKEKYEAMNWNYLLSVMVKILKTRRCNSKS